MRRIEKSVFISYRRTNASWALAIFQALTHRGYDVFFDFSGLASGDFEQTLLENIAARAHFIVLLTPSALERCDDTSDWLRREIEAALDNQRNIIPLMLDGFDFSTPQIRARLTGKLAKLKNYNALNVPVDYFDAAMERLRDRYLNVPLEAVLHPVSNAAQQVTKDQQEDASAAIPVLEQELTAEQFFERGAETDDWDNKIFFYNKAISLKPDYAACFNNRGHAYQQKGNLEEALLNYSQAIRLQPDFAAAFHNRGYARAEKGDLDRALQDYTKAIDLKPDYARALSNRGLARYERGDLEGALSDYDEVIRLEPDIAVACNNRGLAYAAKGDVDAALLDYNEAIRLQPNFPKAYNNRACSRQDKSDLEGALADYDKALNIKPNYARALCNRASAHHEKGDLVRAKQDYDEAVRLEPTLSRHQ